MKLWWNVDEFEFCVYEFFYNLFGIFLLGQVEVNFKDFDYLSIFFDFGFTFNPRDRDIDKK